MTDLKIFSDSRFLNELNFIKEHNGVSIRIIGKDDPKNLDNFHISEKEHLQFKDYKHILINT